MNSTTAVEIEGLEKSYGSTRALDGLNLRIEAGTVAGFLGPNGSGKTTTIRILLGLLRADGGRAVLLGGDPWRDAVELHRRLAYVAGDVTLWPNLTGGEAIDILGSLRGDLDRSRVELFLQRFDLDPNKKARSYSKGNRQKVGLVSAFASRAELLILDEPTNGLDPLMEGVFTECVSEARAEGRSVLLSSHIFAEVEKLCDTVTIIRDGRTVESGTLAELRHLQRSTITVTLGSDPSPLAAIEGVHDLATDSGRTTFTVDSAALPKVLASVASLEPRELVSTPPSLEELFLRHYGVHSAAES
ncbi:MAG: ABC transporter ATP-binding protein [Cryobacterium sp.]|nr:ABC transporter ATP-binding protein [Cryobacterium sp.]MCC7128042.1 ABC transporter ATP-binding protein [Microbacteriaceae bacterium]MCO5294006.1 ABC transporter ATP-binding protein [Homoserinimonas sp.]MBX3090614.1 ABC transporter ATP-binding protein [Cryobacterium sp.]MBX3116247.1 ABC transporter ATP-binding protein [Cryobacterium sp.]